MLSYRHHFHAGNHADVLKHVSLVALLRALTRKNKALCYIDTHAGRGRYLLAPAASTRAPEWLEGLGRILGAADAPAAVTDWRDCLGDLAAGLPSAGSGTAGSYPGSPAIAAQILRPGDRLLLSELHPDDARALIDTFAGDPRVDAAQRDGYAEIARCLPPRERRALMLVDPAYERRDESDRVRGAVDTALARLANASIVVWYPIARASGCERLLRAPPGPNDVPLLHIELCVHPRDNPLGMNGSGLLIWNPPFQFDATLTGCLPWLAARLDQGGGDWQIQWLRAPR